MTQQIPFSNEIAPTTATELARFVSDNVHGARTPLYPVGGRTALRFGNPITRPGTAVSLTQLNDVVDYAARDMTITVQAGIRISDLAETLANEQQRLAVDIPESRRATIGGAIACNTNGPSRFGYGTLRDQLLGVTAIDGQGRTFSAGGRVVKNVAGYDFCKLMVGSLGTLAIMTQVALKLFPVPESRRLLWIEFRDLDHIDQGLAILDQSQTRPVAIDALDTLAANQVQTEARVTLSTDHPVICLMLEGHDDEVAWQTQKLHQEFQACGSPTIHELSGERADRLYQTLVDYPATSDDPLTFQASVLPSQVTSAMQLAAERGIAVQAHAGNGILLGHLPDDCSTAAEAAMLLAPLSNHVRNHHGTLVVLSCPEGWKRQHSNRDAETGAESSESGLAVFGNEFPAAKLSHKIKKTFDPHQILNPGRLPI